MGSTVVYWRDYPAWSATGFHLKLNEWTPVLICGVQAGALSSDMCAKFHELTHRYRR